MATTPRYAVRPSGFAGDLIPKEIFTAIGELIVRWSYVEFQTGVIIREAFNLPKDTGRALIVGMELGVLCGVLRTIAHSDNWIWDDAIRADIKQLAKAIRETADNRHQYAHGVYSFSTADPKTLSRYLYHEKEHRILPSQEPVTVDQLASLIEQARELGVDAQNLTTRIKQWKKSVKLPPAPRQRNFPNQ